MADSKRQMRFRSNILLQIPQVLGALVSIHKRAEEPGKMNKFIIINCALQGRAGTIDLFP